MTESTQHKLDRVRPPRVQITYDVETGGAIEKKELPLVVGILADLSGNPTEPLPKLNERRFIEVDRDNFDQVLESIKPRATLQVDNTISKEGGKLNIELNFKSISDFDPIEIIKQVTPLNRLFQARQRLRDLLTKLDGNDDLDKLLQEVIKKTDDLNEIKSFASTSTPSENASEANSATDQPSADAQDESQPNNEPQA